MAVNWSPSLDRLVCLLVLKGFGGTCQLPSWPGQLNDVNARLIKMGNQQNQFIPAYTRGLFQQGCPNSLCSNSELKK